MNTTDSSATSLSLLDRAQSRDPSAWQRLSRLYLPLVFRWARRAGLQEDDARDVAQEVFRSVAERIRMFQIGQGQGTFRGWLYVITRNKVRDFFRYQAKHPRASGGTNAQVRFAELPEVLSSAEMAAAETELVQRALQLMRTDFQEPTWNAFWKSVVEERSPVEVAEELKISVAAVYQAKSRVLRRLRDELAGLDDSSAT